MIDVYFISDTHFSHANILKFEPVARPFDDVHEMNKEMTRRWNEVVGPRDIVYHLGDFAMGSQGVQCAKLLNGDKRLILGNHDTAPTTNYLSYFTKLYGSLPYKGFICTHIPVSDKQFGRFKGNIHGHLHSNKMEDPRYINVSVEQIDLTPIKFDKLLERWEAQNDQIKTRTSPGGI